MAPPNAELKLRKPRNETKRKQENERNKRRNGHIRRRSVESIGITNLNLSKIMFIERSLSTITIILPRHPSYIQKVSTVKFHSTKPGANT